MVHKEDVLEFLKQNPNVWFTRKQIVESIGVAPENVSKYTKQLVKWNDSVERKEVENTGKGNKYNVLFRYRTEG